MLLRVHKKALALSPSSDSRLSVHWSTIARDPRQLQFYEHLEEHFLSARPRVSCRLLSIGVRKHIISRNKNQKQKIAYTKLSVPYSHLKEPKERRKHEIGRFFIRLRLSYMFGINKIAENLQKSRVKESKNSISIGGTGGEAKSSFKFYHWWPYTMERIWMAHFYGTTLCTPKRLINNVHHTENDSSRENCCDCKRIWPNRGKLSSFYDPEKSDTRLVMFIIRHLFCAITCNKLIISVTLVLNYIPNDERVQKGRGRQGHKHYCK